MDADKLVQVYIKMRDKRSEIKTEYEAKDRAIEEQMKLVESALLKMCKETGADGIKTTHGTATRTIRERIWAADWDAFKEFVRKYDAVDLLEKRVHQGNFREWADKHPDVVAPVNIDRAYAITIRRST